MVEYNLTGSLIYARGKLPVRVNRKVGASIISHYLFPISPRTLERWPVSWRRLNGRALVETDELLSEAQRRVDAAACIRGGARNLESDCLGDQVVRVGGDR